MRRTAAAIVTLLVAALLPAQEWALQRLTSTDELRSVTEQRVRDGYTPVGIDIGDELGLSVLYARPVAWQADSYAIEELDSLDALNRVVTDRIRDGWFPMDFTIHDETYALLFTDSADVIGGWRIVGSDPAFMEVQRTIAGYEADGFTPVGISATDGGQLAILFLRLPERDQVNSVVVGVAPDPEEITIVVQSMVDEGWTPMSVTAAPTELVILFLRL
jgi:hypothetical protein